MLLLLHAHLRNARDFVSMSICIALVHSKTLTEVDLRPAQRLVEILRHLYLAFFFWVVLLRGRRMTRVIMVSGMYLPRCHPSTDRRDINMCRLFDDTKLRRHSNRIRTG